MGGGGAHWASLIAHRAAKGWGRHGAHAHQRGFASAQGKGAAPHAHGQRIAAYRAGDDADALAREKTNFHQAQQKILVFVLGVHVQAVHPGVGAQRQIGQAAFDGGAGGRIVGRHLGHGGFPKRQ
jgi:hypothetical protein